MSRPGGTRPEGVEGDIYTEGVGCDSQDTGCQDEPGQAQGVNEYFSQHSESHRNHWVVFLFLLCMCLLTCI